jgi:hypothetical protein
VTQYPGDCASLVRLDNNNRLIHRFYRFCFPSRFPPRPSPPALPLDLSLCPVLERALPRGSRGLGCFDFPKSAQDAAYTKCKKIHEQQSMNRASSLVESARGNRAKLVSWDVVRACKEKRGKERGNERIRIDKYVQSEMEQGRLIGFDGGWISRAICWTLTSCPPRDLGHVLCSPTTQ